MIPAAGSTYSYAYAAFGVVPRLVHRLGPAARVPVRRLDRRGRLGRATRSACSTASASTSRTTSPTPPFGDDAGIVNLPAIADRRSRPRALLVVGTRESARANNAMVAAEARRSWSLFVVVGAFYVTTANWEPFVPAERGRLRRLRRQRRAPRAPASSSSPTSASTRSRPPPPRRATRSGRSRSGCSATVLISTVLYVAIGARDDRHGPLHAARTSPTRSRRRSRPPGAALDWLDDGGRRRRRGRPRLDRARHLLRPDADLHADVRGRDAAAGASAGSASGSRRRSFATVVCGVAGARRRRAACRSTCSASSSRSGRCSRS